jgi:hypothetical protein
MFLLFVHADHGLLHYHYHPSSGNQHSKHGMRLWAWRLSRQHHTDVSRSWRSKGKLRPNSCHAIGRCDACDSERKDGMSTSPLGQSHHGHVFIPVTNGNEMSESFLPQIIPFFAEHRQRSADTNRNHACKSQNK